MPYSAYNTGTGIADLTHQLRRLFNIQNNAVPWGGVGALRTYAFMGGIRVPLVDLGNRLATIFSQNQMRLESSCRVAIDEVLRFAALNAAFDFTMTREEGVTAPVGINPAWDLTGGLDYWCGPEHNAAGPIVGSVFRPPPPVGPRIGWANYGPNHNNYRGNLLLPWAGTLQSLVVEAKTTNPNSIAHALGQLVAQIVGIRQLFALQAPPQMFIPGIITDGQRWQFVEVYFRTPRPGTVLTNCFYILSAVYDIADPVRRRYTDLSYIVGTIRHVLNNLHRLNRTHF